ncbi:MAG: transporter substrate-binding domain-containing protein [Bacteriovoracaceae bacterium]|nr:transporter substrate-binding domain-containing protein [Bacteriovoracaceae bacterium]
MAYSSFESVFSAHAKVVNVAVIKVAPFAFDSPKLQGIHVDFIKQVFKVADIQLKLVPLPYPRVVDAISKGKVDMALMFKRDFLLNTKVVARSFGFQNIVITPPQTYISEVEGLRGKSIGLIRNARYGKEIDEVSYLQKVFLDNYEQSFKMYRIQRLDSFIISEPAFNFIKQKDEFQDIEYGNPIILNSRHNYFYAHKSLSIQIIQAIEKANSALMSQNYMEKILTKYSAQ